MFDDVGATVRITVAGVIRLRCDLAKCFAALNPNDCSYKARFMNSVQRTLTEGELFAPAPWHRM